MTIHSKQTFTQINQRSFTININQFYDKWWEKERRVITKDYLVLWIVWWLPTVGVSTQLPLLSSKNCSVFLHLMSLPIKSPRIHVSGNTTLDRNETIKCSIIQTTRLQQSGSSLFWHTHIPLSTDTLSETKVIALNMSLRALIHTFTGIKRMFCKAICSSI